MAVKARLTIILKANDTVVAEVEDPTLWQSVLTAINSGEVLRLPLEKSDPESDQKLAGNGEGQVAQSIPYDNSGALGKLATELGIPQPILIGACSPSTDSPFIHLDKHHFEAFKRNVPSRGPNAVGAVVLALTLLVLWKDKAGLGSTAMKEATAVLDTIGVTAKNPTRSINNCEWLQIRNNSVVLNPAETSKALTVAKAYCSKSPSQD